MDCRFHNSEYVSDFSILQNVTTVICKVPLKNSKKKVLLDYSVYEFLSENPYYVSIKLLDNLREHSSGCCIFQKSWKHPNGFSSLPENPSQKFIATLQFNGIPVKNKNNNINMFQYHVDRLTFLYKKRASFSNFQSIDIDTYIWYHVLQTYQNSSNKLKLLTVNLSTHFNKERKYLLSRFMLSSTVKNSIRFSNLSIFKVNQSNYLINTKLALA